MKQLLLSGLLAVALVLSACERQSSVNSPDSPGSSASFSKVADQFSISNEQMGQLDEMYYLGEDLSLLLNSNQISVLNSLSHIAGDGGLQADPPGDRGPRGGLDMEALMIYRLILQANPDMTDEQKAALRAAIDASMQRRMAIMKDPNLDNATKKLQLDEEHQNLMAIIFGKDGNGGNDALLDELQVQRYNELRAQIEQQREEQRAKWIEARIDRQIQMWTKALTLTEDQQIVIKGYLKDQITEIERLRLEYKGQPDLLREAIKKLQDDTNAKIYDQLSEEQKAIWDKMHTPRTGGGTGGTDIGVAREVQYWTKVLALSPEQATSLTDILTKQQVATQEAMKTYRGDPAGLKAELERIRKETDAALQLLLTKEQWAMWQKMHMPTTGGGIGGRG